MTAKRQNSNSSGQTLSFFTMRNKLKRTKKCREPASVRSTEVITLALALVSSCSDEGAAAGVSERKAQPRQDQRKTCSVQDVKIAPIFLRTPLHSKRKVRSDDNLCQSEEKLQTAVSPPPPPPPLHHHQHRLSPVVHLLEEDEDLVSTRRRHVSPSFLRSRLEEIQTSNPAFPVQTVFGTLQKKSSLQGFGSTDNSLHPSSPQKRRRGGESSERVSKRLRCGAEGGVCLDPLESQGVLESTALTVRKQPSNSKLSLSHRLKQRSGSLTVSVNNPELNSEWVNHSESDGQSPIIHDVLHREATSEDVLWTDKYSPQHSREVIGNCGSVNKLQSWLKKWKLRADCDERRKVEERTDEDNSTDSWDCGDFQGETVAEDHREDPLCNTMLITGPPGVGKTASVYACAQELGFKVFEVNCSSQRSGRHVLSQLKEATQSYLVETSGKDPLKPAYLSNYNTSTPKAESLPAGKPVPPKNVTSTSKKKNVGRSGLKGKSNPAAVTLTNYFKMKAKADHLHVGGPTPLEKQDGKKLSPGGDQTVTPSKKKATSLILFEEVDIIFDDDVGFLGAIKSFMATTKRPVILTTNDPLFRERFSCSLEEILFKTPSVVSVCSYLQLVCLSENVPLELDDVRSLLRHTCGDVRRCLLQLQLWALSGGGQAAQSGGRKEPIRVQYLYAAEDGDHLESGLPPWDTSCTATMLGLQPVTRKQLLNLLKCRRWSETDMNKLLRLLSESWRGGEPLLYNNLELLLPNRTSGQHLEKMTCSGLQSELAPPHSDPRVLRLKGDVSPKASVTDGKPFRNISRLSRRKYTATVFEATSTLKQKPQRTSLLLQGVHSRIPSSSDKTEQISDACLDSLTDFFDLMSYLDISLPAAAPLCSGLCSPEAFVWTGAEIKDGLLDESNEEEEEEGGSWSHEGLLDIKAAAEGLGCHRCWWRVSQAWTEAQKQRHELGGEMWERLEERVAFPAPPKRQSLRFSYRPLCGTSVSHRRYDLSRKVLSSESFSLLGNRRAVCVDYMPVLRSICRSHRAQQQEEEPNSTCVNYLRNIHLDLSKSTIQLLAEDFS